MQNHIIFFESSYGSYFTLVLVAIAEEHYPPGHCQDSRDTTYSQGGIKSSILCQPKLWDDYFAQNSRMMRLNNFNQNRMNRYLKFLSVWISHALQTEQYTWDRKFILVTKNNNICHSFTYWEFTFLEPFIKQSGL